MNTKRLSWASVAFLACALGLKAQSPEVLRQATERSTPVRMTAAEIAELGDPFGELVFKRSPQPMTLTGIEDAIQADADARETFVVSEQIAQEDRGMRRMVVSFTGSANGKPLRGNVMLSIFFGAEKFDDSDPVEAVGWDESRGRYNYYKLDVSPGGSRRVWTFRGTSADARNDAPAASGTCLACHINGAPIMKELLFPWTNWDSFKFKASYLRPSGQGAWPIASHQRLSKGLKGAETLEGIIMSSTQRFNQSRVPSLQVGATVSDVRRLLRPVFVTTEFNIVSADVESGMHPFRKPMTGQPTSSVTVPESFFINAPLLQEIGVAEASAFSSVGRLTPAEYANLVRTSRTEFAGVVGDALFAWVTPEPSHIDTSFATELIRKGLLSKHFVAAVMSVDPENAMLSGDRETLLKFVPESFPLVADKDELTRLTIEALTKANPSATSPAGQFLTALRSPDAVAHLNDRIAAYRQRIVAALASPGTRKTELDRLYKLLLNRRRAILAHPILGTLDETDGILFPLPR